MKVIVEADGGSRGNPGPAGFGCVVWSADRGRVLAEHKQAIGVTTNNVAEYRGLIAGLEQARRVGADEVEVLMDSKLVVEQMRGRWKVKHPGLAELHQQARALASTFSVVDYGWIPRERNAHADRLANEAMDAQAAGQVPIPEAVETPGERAGDPPAEAVAVPPAVWTGNRGGPTRLLLLRHGQTELSRQRRYSGRGNPELTDTGRRQASDAARDLVAPADLRMTVRATPASRVVRTELWINGQKKAEAAGATAFQRQHHAEAGQQEQHRHAPDVEQRHHHVGGEVGVPVLDVPGLRIEQPGGVEKHQAELRDVAQVVDPDEARRSPRPAAGSRAPTGRFRRGASPGWAGRAASGHPPARCFGRWRSSP